VSGQRHAQADFSTPGKDTVPILQEALWATGPVWTGAENLIPTGIGSPDRPARSQSLYRLSAGSQDVPCILLKTKVYYRFYKKSASCQYNE
jgi:hypothetical protein